MAEIRVEGVSKTYLGVTALDDVSLVIQDKEFMVLLGPSGCGKTTLLRMIAGFEEPDSGSIHIGGRDMRGVPPAKRGIAMVFQSYALFPHLRVAGNIGFGLRMHKVPAAEVGGQVEKAARLMQIEGLLDRYPSQLSGGQRQRVAVARALVMEPEVILMDEPLSNLDALLRLQMRAELKRLLADVDTTTVYVTHDQVEAMTMGDRTAVLRDGRILQVDTPLAVYDRPADTFVAQFIGNPPMNVLRGTMGDGEVEVEGHRLPVADPDGRRPGEEVEVGIRAENIEVLRDREERALEADIRVIEPLGSHLLITLQLGSQAVKATTRIDLEVERDQRVYLRLQPQHLRLLAR
ncbi:MAG: ABC transporter ATP-binding protein [Chloroflexota bacterium]